MSDSQDQAETFDEDMTGSDPVTIDQVGSEADGDWPPTRSHGIQFADADVSDESFAQRSLQEEPEVRETELAMDSDEDDGGDT